MSYKNHIMSNEIIFGVFFFVVGGLLFYGTSIDIKERKAYLSQEENRHWYYRLSTSIIDLRIGAIAFILVGLGFIYNEVAIYLEWFSLNELFSLIANWLY